jgi:hypothetical protein
VDCDNYTYDPFHVYKLYFVYHFFEKISYARIEIEVRKRMTI